MGGLDRTYLGFTRPIGLLISRGEDTVGRADDHPIPEGCCLLRINLRGTDRLMERPKLFGLIRIRNRSQLLIALQGSPIATHTTIKAAESIRIQVRQGTLEDGWGYAPLRMDRERGAIDRCGGGERRCAPPQGSSYPYTCLLYTSDAADER